MLGDLYEVMEEVLAVASRQLTAGPLQIGFVFLRDPLA